MATVAAPPARALPGGGELRRHVLIAIVLDKPGVLNRVSSLMRARNFDVDSLVVSHTDREDVSRMTITLHGDDVAIEQAIKQLYRLIDVLKVQDVTADPTVEHELAFVKVRATEANRAEILRLVELSRGRVVDLAEGSIVVEVTGTETEIDAFVALVRTYGMEMVRTGAVVMARGSGSIEEAIKRRRRSDYDNDADRPPWPARRRHHRLRRQGDADALNLDERGECRSSAWPRDRSRALAARCRPDGHGRRRCGQGIADVIMILVPDTAQKASTTRRSGRTCAPAIS